MAKSDTSCVPPPQSKINTFFALSVILSNPYAIAAAVGSLIILNISSPAIIPASLVAVFILSVKCAGTVITAFFTGHPKYSSAICFILVKIIAEISSGVKFLISFLYLTFILSLLLSLITLNEKSFKLS